MKRREATVGEWLDFAITFMPGVGLASRVASALFKGGAAAIRAVRTAQVGIKGREIYIGRNFRIAPIGNRAGPNVPRNATRPHYHRRGPTDPATGRTVPGQGIGRHRPWDKSPDYDRSFLDRY